MLKPHGRLAFCTIFTAQGLSAADRRLALRLRPLSVSWHNLPQRELLARAGFVHVRETDLTAEFLRIARLMVESQIRHADGLRPLKPPGDFDRDLKSHIQEVPLIERGVMRRALFVAERP